MILLICKKYIRKNNIQKILYAGYKNMKLQQLLSRIRKAIDDYQMIEENDIIAVGMSGGKDSMTLLYALKQLQRFYPIHFELLAVTVDLGFQNLDLQATADFCTKIDVSYKIIKTQIAEIIFEARKEPNPCSLCAKMRKGAMNQFLEENGIRKVAYAHHKDDFIETMMMSLLFEGRFQSFSPKTLLDKSKITVIRPLIYVNEADVKGFCNKYQIPVTKNPCPIDGHTKREYVKELIKQLNKENPGAKERLYAAIHNFQKIE